MRIVHGIASLFRRGKFRNYSRADLIDELIYYHEYASEQQADSAWWQAKFFALRDDMAQAGHITLPWARDTVS